MEESYELTLPGLLTTLADEETIKSILDTIELYMRRNDKNAIILEGRSFVFREVELVEEESEGK